jgi:hypothetical protein
MQPLREDGLVPGDRICKIACSFHSPEPGAQLMLDEGPAFGNNKSLRPVVYAGVKTAR